MSEFSALLNTKLRQSRNKAVALEFVDLFFSREKYFSVGIEKGSGDYYLSIPVSNRKADYEEYYRIDRHLYEKFKSDLSRLEYVADECRKRLRDDDLFIQPGSDRGTPV